MKKKTKTKKVLKPKKLKPKKAHKKTEEKEWLMPFNASFPRGEEVDFVLEDEDEDGAVFFEFEGDL